MATMHVGVEVDGYDESTHFNMSNSMKASLDDERQHHADSSFYSVHEHIQGKVAAQGDMEVHPSVVSTDMYNTFMVHLTQHSALPPASKLPSLRGTMSAALREVIGNEPKGVKRALSCPHFGAYWKQAMDKELSLIHI